MLTREIYCRLPSDLNYEKKLETDGEIEQILQQVRVVLGTRPGQVLGSHDFGIDLEKYLFGYNVSQGEILYQINNALATYVKFDEGKYTIYADVSFGHDASGTSEYALIDIVINETKCLGIMVSQA